MTHEYKKLPVTMKMWMQFNVMPRTLDPYLVGAQLYRFSPVDAHQSRPWVGLTHGLGPSFFSIFHGLGWVEC